jgi:hypothetical protein
MVDNKNYLACQGELRARLLVIMKHSEQPLRKIADEIGIVVATLRVFIAGKDTDWPRLCKIEKYVVKYENFLRYKK